jgi:hypothetical protein
MPSYRGFSKHGINQKLEHFYDIKELFGRIGVVFYKTRFVPS